MVLVTRCPMRLGLFLGFIRSNHPGEGKGEWQTWLYTSVLKRLRCCAQGVSFWAVQPLACFCCEFCTWDRGRCCTHAHGASPSSTQAQQQKTDRHLAPSRPALSSPAAPFGLCRMWQQHTHRGTLGTWQQKSWPHLTQLQHPACHMTAGKASAHIPYHSPYRMRCSTSTCPQRLRTFRLSYLGWPGLTGNPVFFV